MSPFEPNQPIFAASADRATDWSSISAGARLDFDADIQIRRGVDIDLGLSLMANLDASFRQFLAADLQGQLQGQASVRGQVQLPMNLFDEAGFAVRLQAVAELAAGLRVGLGLTFEDFLGLAAQDPNMTGTPLKLLRVFLEQVVLEASFFAKAAVSAQAYANVVAVGSLIANPRTGAAPRFLIAAGAGAGLKAGAGYQISASMDLRNVSELVAKTVDILVDDATKRIADGLPSSAAAAQAAVRAARMPARLALRLAFELGEHLALNDPQHSSDSQDAASQSALQVVLEELQRATFEGLLEAAVQKITALLNAAAQAATAEWTACRAERHAVADHLRAAPDPLFSLEAVPFWLTLTERVAALAARLPSAPKDLSAHATTVWCAARLLEVVTERVLDPDRTHRNRPLRQRAPAFDGALNPPPPSPVDGIVLQTLQRAGTPVTGPLRLEHLALYLADRTVVDLLRQTNPAAAAVLARITGPFAPDLDALVGLILKNATAFPVASGGPPDPTAALRALAGGVTDFVNTTLDDALRQGLQPVFDRQPDLQLIFDEVMVPSLRFALDVAVVEATTWASSSTPPKVLTEGLSAVLLRVLGRSLVATGDILLFEAQRNMSTLLRDVAAGANRPNGLVPTLAGLPGIGVAAADVAELVTDALEIAADVFGPLPADKRRLIRGLLYQAIDPLGGKPARDIMQALNDPGLPNAEVMEALGSELGHYAVDRFLVFVERLVGRLLEHLADEFRAVLDQAAQVIAGWVRDVQHGIDLAAQRLNELLGDIAEAIAEIQRQTEQALDALADTLESFSSRAARDRFVDGVVDAAYSVALGALHDNFVYRTLVPGDMKRAIRHTVKSLLRAAAAAAPIDSVLALIGELANEVDDLVDDARAIPPGPGFAAGVRELVLGRLVAIVEDRFGTLRLGVRFTVDIPFVGSKTIDLGSVTVPMTALTGSVRPMVAGLAVFDDAIDAFAARLAALFAAEGRHAELSAERQSVRDEHTRLTGLLDVVATDTPRVEIERPVNLQGVGGGAELRVRLVGLRASLLDTAADVPPRVHVLLNGHPVDPSVLHRSESGTAAMPLSPIAGAPGGLRPLPIRNTGTLRGGRLAARRADHNPQLGSPVRRRGSTQTVGATQAEPSTLLVGTLPADVLAPGLNSLLVEVIVDAGRRYHASVGFFSSDGAAAGSSAATAAADDEAPADRTPARGAPPKARPPTRSDLALLLPSERRLAAGRLAPMVARPPERHPLHPLAVASPRIGDTLGLRVQHRPGLRPPVRLTRRP